MQPALIHKSIREKDLPSLLMTKTTSEKLQTPKLPVTKEQELREASLFYDLIAKKSIDSN